MHVVVVGGGVIGLLTALELSRSGVRITLLEQGATGREASWAGGGIVSPLYPWRYPPAVSSLAIQAQAMYPELVDSIRRETGVDPELNRCGMLMLEAEDSRDALAWAEANGRDMFRMEGSELEAMGAGLSAFRHGLWLPSIANVRNPRLLAALRRALELRGGVVREQCPVASWVTQGDTVEAARCADGVVVGADAFVLAAGAWSSRLTEGTGLELPVRPVRGQMLLFNAPASGLRQILLHRGHYLIPRLDGHVLCGSTLEECGFDKGITTDAAALLLEVAHRLAPGLRGLRPVAQWSGLRPGSPNGIPYIGPHPRLGNLWLNTGHFRNGLVLAPASARLLADLMLARPTGLDPRPYRPA